MEQPNPAPAAKRRAKCHNAEGLWRAARRGGSGLAVEWSVPKNTANGGRADNFHNSDKVGTVLMLWEI